MDHVIVEDLRKTYRIGVREPGLLGAWRGLLHRRHRSVQALAGVSFSLPRGELLGFVGHDMHDIEALAQRVLVIGHGRVLADTSVDALRAQVQAGAPSVATRGDAADGDTPPAQLAVEEVITRFYALHGATEA